MTNIAPGAIWTPVDVGSRAARRKGRGLIGHIAVSNAVNLVPSGAPATRSADWHFYLPKEAQPAGRFFQYIDLDLQSWSSYQANPDTASFESQGGVGADVSAPWTDNQVESAAIILAYLNETEGVPLQDMVNSLPGSRGFGVHRYGIDPWRVAGGQIWSSSRGKVCPGDARVAQVPVIISRAAEIRGGSPSPTPTPAPAPAPAHSGVGFIGSQVLPAWNLPRGYYLGDRNGPKQEIGGYYGPEPHVEAVQRLWIAAGLVPGVPASQWRTSRWADGKWDARYSDPVCRAWFARFRNSQPIHNQVWSDDYAVMRGQRF